MFLYAFCHAFELVAQHRIDAKVKTSKHVTGIWFKVWKMVKGNFWLAINQDYYAHGALAPLRYHSPEIQAKQVKRHWKTLHLRYAYIYGRVWRTMWSWAGKHIEKFLVEMGAGFAFMGRQYIEVSGNDFISIYWCTFIYAQVFRNWKRESPNPNISVSWTCFGGGWHPCRARQPRPSGCSFHEQEPHHGGNTPCVMYKPIGTSDYELGSAAQR